MIVAIGASIYVPTLASAQQSAVADESDFRVAVIDVGVVFKNLPAIKALVSETKRAREKNEAARNQQRDTLKQAVEQLRALEPGTSEFAEQEAYVAKLDLKMRLPTCQGHHDLSDAETTVLRDSYQRIIDAVSEIAEQRNIAVVVRIDSGGSGSGSGFGQGDSATRTSMNHVIFHDETVDITGAVIRRLEQHSKSPQVATPGSEFALPTIHP
ncbi:MAG: OmpH family outer membrane protein [Planctomycetales bacterium]|nr:OmpH family outer membrane protein [Planctomycetales bacterium]